MNDTAEKAKEKAHGLSQAHKERAKGLACEARGRGKGRGEDGDRRQGPPEHAKAYGYRGTSPERGKSEDRRQDGGRGPRDEIKERIANMRARRGGR